MGYFIRYLIFVILEMFDRNRKYIFNVPVQFFLFVFKNNIFSYEYDIKYSYQTQIIGTQLYHFKVTSLIKSARIPGEPRRYAVTETAVENQLLKLI